MLGYAVEYNEFYYEHQIAHRIEKTFQTEQMAWEYIESKYYKCNPNRIESARICIGEKGYRKGFYIYGESFTNEYKIYKTIVVLKPDQEIEEFANSDRLAYEKLLYVLYLLYKTAKDDDEKERFYHYTIEVYDIMNELAKEHEDSGSK